MYFFFYFVPYKLRGISNDIGECLTHDNYLSHIRHTDASRKADPALKTERAISRKDISPQTQQKKQTRGREREKERGRDTGERGRARATDVLKERTRVKDSSSTEYKGPAATSTVDILDWRHADRQRPPTYREKSHRQIDRRQYSWIERTPRRTRSPTSRCNRTISLETRTNLMAMARSWSKGGNPLFFLPRLLTFLSRELSKIARENGGRPVKAFYETSGNDGDEDVLRGCAGSHRWVPDVMARARACQISGGSVHHLETKRNWAEPCSLSRASTRETQRRELCTARRFDTDWPTAMLPPPRCCSGGVGALAAPSYTVTPAILSEPPLPSLPLSLSFSLVSPPLPRSLPILCSSPALPPPLPSPPRNLRRCTRHPPLQWLLSLAPARYLRQLTSRTYARALADMSVSSLIVSRCIYNCTASSGT